MDKRLVNSMISESEEEYLGAIYRLRESTTKPLPLSNLSSYFDFSPVSVHEMVQKLVLQEYIKYHPYYGVTLSRQGEVIAESLIRRHRLWERFLTDVLEIPWEDAHEIAGQLEHAATGQVTEKLAHFLGEPEVCPHGETIPPALQTMEDVRLLKAPVGSTAQITRISPETPELLHRVREWELKPGYIFRVLEQTDDFTQIACESRTIKVPSDDAKRIWTAIKDQS